MSLTTQRSPSPHTSLRCCSEHGHTGWRHTDPRCVRRLDVRAPGTFRLFLWRTAHQKCTLWREQTHRRILSVLREGVIRGKHITPYFFFFVWRSKMAQARMWLIRAEFPTWLCGKQKENISRDVLQTVEFIYLSVVQFVERYCEILYVFKKKKRTHLRRCRKHFHKYTRLPSQMPEFSSSRRAIIIFAFCFHNSISSRQYLPWPLPAEHRALYKYEARAQASQSSAHAACLLSAALVTGINRMQGKCHARSWIFMEWCYLLGTLKWRLWCGKRGRSKSEIRFMGEIIKAGYFCFRCATLPLVPERRSLRSSSN